MFGAVVRMPAFPDMRWRCAVGNGCAGVSQGKVIRSRQLARACRSHAGPAYKTAAISRDSRRGEPALFASSVVDARWRRLFAIIFEYALDDRSITLGHCLDLSWRSCADVLCGACKI